MITLMQILVVLNNNNRMIYAMIWKPDFIVLSAVKERLRVEQLSILKSVLGSCCCSRSSHVYGRS
jgi:hypothetical protein